MRLEMAATEKGLSIHRPDSEHNILKSTLGGNKATWTKNICNNVYIKYKVHVRLYGGECTSIIAL